MEGRAIDKGQNFLKLLQAIDICSRLQVLELDAVQPTVKFGEQRAPVRRTCFRTAIVG